MWRLRDNGGMPLDTLPLTPARRLLALLLLAALFAASLGFAAILVSRRQSTVTVSTALPSDFSVPCHDFDGAPGLMLARQTAGRVVRRVAIFEFDGDTFDPDVRARDLFTELFGANPEESRDALLGGRQAVEVAGRFGKNSAGWLRLAVAGGQAVAFCYSGENPQPDVDASVFDSLARQDVQILVASRTPSTPK